MGKFRKKPVIIEAFRWFRNGDHPKDGDKGKEGKIVRYFRRPGSSFSDSIVCPQCNQEYRAHGWIDTLEAGHCVCPGDWIITGVKGKKYPCKPDIFEETYEVVEQ
jgi:hypothetical protein